MSVQLKLDHSALVALFPEGGEARVELQRAVINEFVRKHIKVAALGSELGAMVAKAKQEAVTNTLRELGLTQDVYLRVMLDGSARGKIGESVRREFRDEAQKHITLAVDSLRATISHDLQAAVNRLVDKEIGNVVKERVQAVAKSLQEMKV